MEKTKQAYNSKSGRSRYITLIYASELGSAIIYIVLLACLTSYLLTYIYSWLVMSAAHSNSITCCTSILLTSKGKEHGRERGIASCSLDPRHFPPSISHIL
jgi:ABC-type multidrug transport system permease subunit